MIGLSVPSATDPHAGSPVDVIQQPSADNNYTGIIRLYDVQSRFGHYSFNATWQ